MRQAVQNHWRTGNKDPQLALLPKPAENLANWKIDQIYSAQEFKFFDEENDDEINSETEELSD